MSLLTDSILYSSRLQASQKKKKVDRERFEKDHPDVNLRHNRAQRTHNALTHQQKDDSPKNQLGIVGEQTVWWTPSRLNMEPTFEPEPNRGDEVRHHFIKNGNVGGKQGGQRGHTKRRADKKAMNDKAGIGYGGKYRRDITHSVSGNNGGNVASSGGNATTAGMKAKNTASR